MSMRFWLTLALCFSLPSLAQEDDDLAPLAPSKPKAKAPAPPPVRRPPPPAKAKAPPPPPKQGKAQPPADDDLAPLAPAKGELLVKVPATLSGATLLVDGKEVGPLPSAAQSFSPGEHTVMVKRVGFANFVKKVTVTTGKTVELDVKMAPTTAVLTITSDVADAQVYINNKLIGTTPITEREWPAGTYEITLKKDGFKDEKQSLALAVGRDYPVSVKLKSLTPAVVAAAPTVTTPPPSDRPVDTSLEPANLQDTPLAVSTPVQPESPIYQRWYFWVGVGAVVAAGVTTGLLVAQPGAKPRPLGYKDFCENGVCSSGCEKTGTCPIACINIAQCAASFSGAPAGALSF